MRTVLIAVSFLWLLMDVSVLNARVSDDAQWFVVLFGVVILFLLVTQASMDNQSTRYYRRK